VRIVLDSKESTSQVIEAIALSMILFISSCEFYQSKNDALRRKRYFKRTMGKKALKLMLRESLNGIGSAGFSSYLRLCDFGG